MQHYVAVVADDEQIAAVDTGGNNITADADQPRRQYGLDLDGQQDSDAAEANHRQTDPDDA